MQIRSLGAERQSQLKGNVVNIENDLDICAKVIPREFEECSTVQIKLMRRLKDKNPYMYEVVRPYHVYKAAQFLQTTPLYKQYNVQLSSYWSSFNYGMASFKYYLHVLL